MAMSEYNWLPYLPPRKPEYVSTMVCDLDQTLVFYDRPTENIVVRPGAATFLKAVNNMNVELVIYTAATEPYAKQCVEKLTSLDPTIEIDHVLHRRFTIKCGEYYLKDLYALGRDISTVLMVDDIPRLVMPTVSVIPAQPYHGTPNDPQPDLFGGVLAALRLLRLYQPIYI